MLPQRQVLFGLILSIYLTAGVMYAFLTPAWQAPDEPAHYNYVRYLVSEFRLPELKTGCYNEVYLAELKSRKFSPDLSIEPVCYEYHQPPLYYLLLTVPFYLSDGALIPLRLVSVALGAGVVVLSFYIGNFILPHKSFIAYGTMALVGFVPMHVAILASVNNDALAELIFALILLLLVRLMLSERPVSRISLVMLGLLLGISLITKATIYIAVPLVGLALGLRYWLESELGPKSATRHLFQRAVIIFGMALLIGVPWFGRNMALYGGFDLLGLVRHDQVVVGQLRTSQVVAEQGLSVYLVNLVTTTFRSFWGQFGWMAVPMDGRTYFLLTLLVLIAIGGLGLSARSGFIQATTAPRKATLLLLAAAIGLQALAYSGYNLSFVQFQGRYLFPALIPLAFFIALGLSEALDQRWCWWLVGSLLLALIVTVGLTGGSPDKWLVAIIGGLLLLAISRCLSFRFRSQLTLVLWLACYGGLGFLVLASPFWFIGPYL